MISGNSFGSIHLLNHQGDHVLLEKELVNCFGQDRLKSLLNEKAVDFVAYRSEKEGTCYVHNKEGKAIIQKTEGKYSYYPDTSDPLGLKRTLHTNNHREALEVTFNSEYPDAFVQIDQLLKAEGLVI